MPRFCTRLVNDALDCSDEGIEFQNAEKAAAAAVLGALDVARELLSGGERVTQIEVIVSDDVGVVSRRFLTVSVADLHPDDRSPSAN